MHFNVHLPSLIKTSRKRDSAVLNQPFYYLTAHTIMFFFVTHSHASYILNLTLALYCFYFEKNVLDLTIQHIFVCRVYFLTFLNDLDPVSLSFFYDSIF